MDFEVMTAFPKKKSVSNVVMIKPENNLKVNQ